MILRTWMRHTSMGAVLLLGLGGATAERQGMPARVVLAAPAASVFGPPGILYSTAIGAQGNVFVVARTAGQVVKLSASGRLLARWSIAPDPATSSGPDLSGIAADSAGNLYVSDAANDRIIKLSSEGKGLAQWNTAHKRQRVAYGAMGVALDRQGNVYTTNFDHSDVEKYSPSGRLLARFAKGFDHPDGIAVDARGNIYVNDHRSSRIVKLSPAGHQLRAFGPSLAAPYQNLDQPEGVAVDSHGNIYVAHDDLVKLSPSGKPLAQWTPPSGDNPYGGMGFDDHGNLFVTVGGGPPPVFMVVKFSPSLHVLAEWK